MNELARSKPSDVMSRYSTSAKNFGSTHVAFGFLICLVSLDLGLTTVSSCFLIWLETVRDQPVPTLLPKTRVMFLHFDDVHNVLQQNKKEVKKVQATFRNLMISRDWPVQLILSGTKKSLELFDFEEADAQAEDQSVEEREENDRQLSRRLEYVMFDDLDPAADADWLMDVLTGFAEKAGLKYKERSGSMLIERLCHASAYQFGLAIELLLAGIRAALVEKSRTFDIDDLAHGYAKRTSQPVQLNIFLSPAWQSIDPKIIFKKGRA